MYFKKDDNLVRLAAMTNKDAETFTRDAIQLLDAKEIVTDEELPELFGAALQDCTERDIDINEVKDILHELGVAHVNGDILDMFGNLIMIGEGDCPECGGRMDYVGDSEETQGDGYYTPREPMCEIWKCPVCGHIEKR